MRNVGEILFEYQALVVDSPGVAVAAAQNSDPDFPAAKPACQPLDHRGLTRTAERQIPNRNDRNKRTMTSQPTAIEPEIANGSPPHRTRLRRARRTPRAKGAAGPCGLPRINRK